MNVSVNFALPKEDVPMRDCINGQRWRAVCINLETYLEEEIRNTEDFDAVIGLEMAQEKFYELLSYFDVQTFSETLVDEPIK
jgi:hypothetical protein